MQRRTITAVVGLAVTLAWGGGAAAPAQAATSKPPKDTPAASTWHDIRAPRGTKWCLTGGMPILTTAGATCRFAANVITGSLTNGTQRFRAYSPQTRKSYPVRCTSGYLAEHDLDFLHCRSGRGMRQQFVWFQEP